jgi:hypothetical protein
MTSVILCSLKRGKAILSLLAGTRGDLEIMRSASKVTDERAEKMQIPAKKSAGNLWSDGTKQSKIDAKWRVSESENWCLREFKCPQKVSKK